MAKYGPKAQAMVEQEMKAMEAGKLRSGSGAKVTNPKQAIAIALSEAREAGAKMPPAPAGTASAEKSTGVGKKVATKKAVVKKAVAEKAVPSKAAAKKEPAKKADGKKAAKKQWSGKKPSAKEATKARRAAKSAGKAKRAVKTKKAAAKRVG